MVYYSQRDPQWADIPYSIAGNPEQTIGSSGCVPTNQSIIRSHYESTSVLPPEMAAWNLKHGFRTLDDGTDSLRSMPAFAEEFGYELHQLDASTEAVARALGEQCLVHVTAVAPEEKRGVLLGTPGGHAILIRKVRRHNEANLVQVHNCVNVAQSKQEWNLEELLATVDSARVFSIRPKKPGS